MRVILAGLCVLLLSGGLAEAQHRSSPPPAPPPVVLSAPLPGGHYGPPLPPPPHPRQYDYPRGYNPYGGAYYPTYPMMGYGGYGPWWLPQIGVAITPGSVAVMGNVGGMGVFYERERQTVQAPPQTVQVEVVNGGVQGLAYVLFEVDALDAEVYVNGSYEGVVEHFTQRPLELPAGAHTIELRWQGKQTTFPVRLDAHSTIRIRARLAT